MEKFYKPRLYQSLFLAIFLLPLSAHSKPKSFAADNYENGSINESNSKTSDDALLECEHPFKINQWDVDESRIEKCFKKLHQEKIKSFEVSAATSVKDSAETDDKLSDNRQEALFSTLNKLYPGVKIYKKPNNRKEEINPNRGGVIVAHFDEESDECEVEEGQAFQTSNPCKIPARKRPKLNKNRITKNRTINPQNRFNSMNNEFSDRYAGADRYGNPNSDRFGGADRYGNPNSDRFGGGRIFERQGRLNGYSEHYTLNPERVGNGSDAKIVFQCNTPINNTNNNTNNNRSGEGGYQQIPAAPTQHQIIPVEGPAPKTKTVYVDRPVPCQATLSQYLDFAIWGGLDVLFFPDIYKNYVTQPAYGFIAGVTKGFYHSDSGFTVLYTGLVVDYLSSEKETGVDTLGFSNKTIFHVMNLELLLGIEQYLASDIFGLFLEIGPSVQQRNLYIRQETTAVSDYSISTLLGASGNLGLTAHLSITDNFAFLIRGALSAHIGQSKPKDIELTGETVNTNPFLWGGNISIGIQF